MNDFLLSSIVALILFTLLIGLIMGWGFLKGAKEKKWKQ